MPTYEYRCASCKHRFEKFQPITAKPVRACPKCHKPKAKRQMGSGGGFLFKGSGFYITDYRSGSYKSRAKSDSSAASPASSTTKSDKGGAKLGGGKGEKKSS